MRVVFDHQIFSLQRYGGISQSFAANVGPLRARGVDVGIGCAVTINGHLQGPALRIPARLAALPVVKRGLLAANRNATRRMVRRSDVVHTTYYLAEDLAPALERPMVATVHDMIPELFPQDFVGNDPHAGKGAYVAAATMVVCVSEHTRRDAVRLFGLPLEKTIVVHHGIDLDRVETDVAPLAKMPERYVLFVGRRRGYKNFDVAFDAFARIAADHRDVHLVCVGGGPFTDEESTRASEVDLGRRVHQVRASDRQLRWLYRHAAAFVFPSRYEGFGIPILEAFAQRCPTILARASCFPEIAGSAAEYFEPDDVARCADLIESALLGRLGTHTAAGYERCRDFTPEHAARGLEKAYAACLAA